MKLIPVLSLLLALGSGQAQAQALREAEQLLQSRSYAEAAEKLAAVPADQQEGGYAQWLRAVALQAAGKLPETVTACDAVPADSKWHRKARLLKARALTDLKKHAEAETIYAEEAARALSSARKDELAGLLVAFADEAATEPAPGEIDAPKADPARAAKLYQEALTVEFLTPGFLDETIFKLAATLQKLGQHQNALLVLNDYLVQFDKAWEPIYAAKGQDYSARPDNTGSQGGMGPAVEKPRDAKRFLQDGKHIHEARLRVAQSQLILAQHAAARGTVEKLLALQPAPDAGVVAAASWLRCGTFAGEAGQKGIYTPYGDQLAKKRSGNSAQQQRAQGAADQILQEDVSLAQQQVDSAPAPAADPAKHTEALRAFLITHAASPHAPEAARFIAENLFALGKTDDGIGALQAFIEGKGYQFDPAAEANRKPDAVTGQTPAEALEQQKQAAFFRIAQIESDRKAYDKAIAKWRDYTVNYPNGAQWAAAQKGMIDAEFSLGIAAVAAGDEKLARERFDAFLTKYPLDERARQILFIYGQIPYAAALVAEMEATEAGKLRPQAAEDGFNAAMSEWARLIAKYPQTEEASLALYNTALILTDKMGRMEEGLAAFRRLTWGQWAAAAKERVGILEEKSLAISAPKVFRTNEAPHLEVSVRNIKKLKVSRYPLNLEGWLRSVHRLGGLEKLDVDLIAPEKTWEVDVADYRPYASKQQQIAIPFPDNTGGASVVRVEGEDWQATTLVVRSDIELMTQATRGEVLVFALNARENKPAADAPVLISDGTKIIAEGKTGADGVFRHREGSGDKLPDTVRAFVLSTNDAMVSGLDLTALTQVQQPKTTTHTTFDRPQYFPGQTAQFVIVRHNVDGVKLSGHTGKGTLRILAPDDRLVMAKPVEWAAGTITGSFNIPSTAPAGEYKVQILDTDEKIIVRGPFIVNERPQENTPQLTLKLDSTAVKPGGKIAATLFADWPWGLPVSDEDVEITFPDGKTERRKTDAAGVLSFEFTATTGAEAWRSESVSVRMPRQCDACRVAGQFGVYVQDWTLGLMPQPPVIAAGSPLNVTAVTNAFDGAPVSKPVQGALYRLTAPPPSRVLEGVPWISYTPPAVAEEKVEEFTLTTDAATGRAVHAMKAPSGGHYVIRCTGDDGKLKSEQPLYVAGDSDPHGLRLYTERNSADEGTTAKLSLQALKAHAHVLVTVSTEQFHSHQIMAVPAGLTEIPVPVTAELAPGFRITATAMDGTNLRAASTVLSVRRGLKFSVTPPAKPGDAPGIEVTDLAGKPVNASLASGFVRTSDDPDALAYGYEGPGERELTASQNTRDLRLAVHTSAALMFPGTSVKVNPATGAAAETKVAAANDQQNLIRVQNLELSFNSGNSLLQMNNGNFALMNCFVQTDSPQSRLAGGALLFAEGVRRQSDTFIQSAVLPAVPDAVQSTLYSVGFFAVPDIAPAGPVVPAARIFKSSGGGTGQMGIQSLNNTERILFPQDGANDDANSSTGTSDSPGDSEKWATASGSKPRLDPAGLQDGRWSAVVRAWTPEHGMVESSVPFVIRHPLGLRAVRAGSHPGPGAAVLVITNRDGVQGEVKADAFGFEGGDSKLTLKPGAVRQVHVFAPQAKDAVMNASIMLSNDSGMLATPAQWDPPFTLQMQRVADAPRLVITGGGVFTDPADITLSLPGVPVAGLARQTEFYESPDELLGVLGVREAGGDLVFRFDLNPAMELLARVTLIQRLREGNDAQKHLAETLLARCVDLVSEIALLESNGGWSWEGMRASPDLLVTVQTWWALTEAKKAGITVSDKLKARVEKFIAAGVPAIAAEDYEKKAAVLHGLAAAGEADYANAAPLLRVKDKLTDTAVAFLTAALVRMERMDEARQLLALLDARATKGSAGGNAATAVWKPSTNTVRLSEPELVTALALWSYARLQPDSPTGAAAANWLLGSRLMSPDGGSRSLGVAVVALDAWFRGANNWPAPAPLPESLSNGFYDKDKRRETGPVLQSPATEGANTFEIRPKAERKIIASVMLLGTPDPVPDPKPWTHPEIASRKYLHTALLHGDTPLNAASTSPVSVAELGQRVRVEVRLKSTAQDVATHPQYLVWDEPLPDCFQLVPGTLAGNFSKGELLPGRIRLTYAPGVVQHLSYEIVALVPGVSTIAPSLISDAYDPAKFRPGTAATLKVLPPGEKSPDAYAMNQAEHFELAKRTFDGGQSEECLKHLEALAPSARRADFEKDLARMKLWLLTDKPDGDAAQIVSAFETLNERHPSLVIPFDRILRVGAAYQKIGEHERGAYVFSAALDANFLTDSSISAALEDHGDFAGSVDFQERLWLDAPDSEDPRGALFALTQALFRKANELKEPAPGEVLPAPVRRGQARLEKKALLARSRDLLTRYITLYPADAQADDAAFSLTNAFFALKDYAGVVTAAEAAAKRHTDSPFLGQFQYMAALGHFWQFHFDAALASAAPVANGETKDRDLARYITGQIHHAQGKTAEAVDWYAKVKAKYADAADALAAFEEKKIGVPEIATWKPGEEVKLAVTHRNVKAVSLQIYKVDLMKLYLREKNLSRVTRVNLAGIAPEAAVPLDVAAAAPWTEHKADVALPLKDEGAYLVIARGDDLFTSGLVLISALKLDVREDAAGGSVRVNVLNAADGKYVADAEVKAIASASTDIQSGQTDPRGIYEATGLSGMATVIVRQGENRFAFHRGTVELAGASTPESNRRRITLPTQADPFASQQEFDPPQIPQSFGGQQKVLSKDAYLENLSGDNRSIQDSNVKNWDFKRRSGGKGVEAQKAAK